MPDQAQRSALFLRRALQAAAAGAGGGGQLALGNHFSAVFLSHFGGLHGCQKRQPQQLFVWLSEPPGGNVFKHCR
jgi:hypothetical protein